MSGVKILEVCMHNDYNEWSVIRQKRMSNLKTIVERAKVYVVEITFTFDIFDNFGCI